MSAGRGGEIGGNRYGVSVDVVKYMNDRSINTFRPLSEKWHRFLGLDSFNTSKGQKHMTPLVVVLPTGGVSTAKEASVNSTEWHPGLTDPATLVFVSADRIIGSGFLSYAELLHSKGLLRRVFVDECSIDNEDKLAVWMETGGLIVATSALGTGVDFPGIVFILHMDLPYGMIDYAQESGRAGRAGEEVDSIIIVEQGKVESMRQAGRIRGLDEEIMAEFVTTRALERLHEKNGKERKTVEKTLDDLTDGCASCWMLAVTQNRGHEGNNDLWTHSAQDSEKKRKRKKN
ncbi:hypothetical protein D6D11_09937 [Aureobasidium pullulans]|nr:hypothetical protein D6D11_09937 [Aureobasidium pullulans]